MTTLVLRAPSGVSSFFHKLGHEIHEFFEGIREANEMAARYEALSRLSDEALARRGLTRADIPRAALNGRTPR